MHSDLIERRILNKKLRIFLLTLIIFAIILRVFLCLFTPLYDNDELYIHYSAEKFSINGKLSFFSYLYEPAVVDATLTGLFYKIIKNNSYYAGKIFEMFWGIGLIVLTFIVGTNCYQNRDIGILSSFLVSLSLPHILHSVLYLKYMKASFFVLISIYLFCLAIHKNNKNMSILAGFFISFAYLTKFFIIISLIAILALSFNRKYKTYCILFLISSFSLYLLFMYLSAGNNFLSAHISLISRFISHFAKDSKMLESRISLRGILDYRIFNPLIFILFFGGLLKSSYIIDRVSIYLVCIFIFYILFNPFFHYPRLLIPVFPLMCLVSAKVLYIVMEKISFRGGRLIIILVLILSFSTTYYTSLPSIINNFGDSLSALYVEDILSEKRSAAVLCQSSGREYFNDFKEVVFPCRNYVLSEEPSCGFLIINKNVNLDSEINRIYDNGFYMIVSKNYRAIPLNIRRKKVFLSPLCGNLLFNLTELYFSTDEKIVLNNLSPWSNHYNLIIETDRNRVDYNIKLKGNDFKILNLDSDNLGKDIVVTVYNDEYSYKIYRKL